MIALHNLHAQVAQRGLKGVPVSHRNGSGVPNLGARNLIGPLLNVTQRQGTIGAEVFALVADRRERVDRKVAILTPVRGIVGRDREVKTGDLFAETSGVAFESIALGAEQIGCNC